MPSKTLEDRVDDLTKLAHGIAEQVRALAGQLGGVSTEKAELAREVTNIGKNIAILEQQLKDLRAWKDGFGTIDQVKIGHALLQKEVDALKKWQEEVKQQKSEISRRLWALAGPILGAVVGAVVGWFLGYMSRPR
jgi:chromosome segregation ATPase